MRFFKLSAVTPDQDFINKIGTRRKYHGRPATSAYEGLTDMTNVVADFRL